MDIKEVSKKLVNQIKSLMSNKNLNHLKINKMMLMNKHYKRNKKQKMIKKKKMKNLLMRNQMDYSEINKNKSRK